MSDRSEAERNRDTAHERIPDEAIAKGVRSALLIKIQFQMHPIEVTVKDGVVTLRGKAESATQRQEAGQLAVMAAGVRDVVNLIDVPGDLA